uniref:Cytochrome P450 family 2 subfamily J member 2 n=1 Tax=Xenopus tropicalis TaxID=8364 RepID=A0A6I8RMA8_XENTR
MELGIALLLGLVILVIFCCKKQQPVGFPPGPAAMPVLGNILQMDFSNPLKDLQKLSEVYGPVYSIYLGLTPAVVVRGFKEVLVTQGIEFADRPQNRLTNLISTNKGLVAAAYGLSWKEHRRFTLSTLRTFGLGKKSMQEKILEESEHLIYELNNHKDSLLEPHFVLDNAVSNIICSVVFGRRYDYHDSTLRNVLYYVHENMKLASSIWAQLYNTFGFIHYLPLPHRKIFQNLEIIFGFLRSILEEHKRSRLPGEPRDFIDCYLEELSKDNRKTTFGEDSLFFCVTDLFVAGTETTSASLQWGLLYMIMFPEIQEKCREEIDRVLGTRDHLEYEDRENMTYTQAVLQEVQRFASVVPLGVPHSTIKDVQLHDFTIPKGTLIITDLSSVHYDETHWKYPHEFNPENFLNEEGELLKIESFLPFSAGPRVCLGENLARMEIFLFFTAMLQHFEFHLPDPTCRPDFTPVFGLTQAPKQFKMKLVPRRQT